MTSSYATKRPRASTRSRGQPPGFTLIELLVAMAIVAILSALAWPGYGAIVQRAQRTDARLALLGMQHLQERHYATHLRYAARLGDTPDAETLATPARSQGGHYLLSVTTSGDGQHFTAVARAASSDGQRRHDPGCEQLSVDEIGRRQSANALGEWTEDDPERCWG
jgi:type IV pilus assembly protein PilE